VNGYKVAGSGYLVAIISYRKRGNWIRPNHSASCLLWYWFRNCRFFRCCRRAVKHGSKASVCVYI